MRYALLLLVGLAPWAMELSGAGNLVYLHSAFVQLLAAAFCLRASQHFATEQTRWRMIASALGIHALPYLASSAQTLGWMTEGTSAWIGNLGNALGMILLITALLGKWTERRSALQFLDLALVTLSVLLLMATYGSGANPGEGSVRIWTGIVLLTVVTVLAFSLRFADLRPGLRHFTRIMVRFLVWELLDTVLINVLLPRYLPQTPDAVVDILIPLPELLLCTWVLRSETVQPLRWFRLDRTVVDSMQPSVLTVLSVVLALYAFRHEPVIAATSVIAVVLCYAVRTQVYYAELFQERSRLLSKATEYQQLATRDPLTGIGNRRWFEANLQAAFSNPDTFPCTLLLVDTDNFKQVNDSYGHDTGDAVLCAIASMLEREVDSTRQACIARIGGDEFAVLLRNTAEDEAHSIAHRIRTSVAQFSEGKGYPVTISVGGRTVHQAVPRKDLLEAADAALYRAKAAGRNSVQGLLAV